MIGGNWHARVLASVLLLGCGEDRRSGAAPAADSGQASVADNTAARVTDTTAPSSPDTIPPAARMDSSPARSDTAKVAARQTQRPKPSPKPSAPRRPVRPVPADTATPPPTQTAETTSATPATPSETSAPLRDAYHQAPRDTVSQQVYDGWKQYNLNCARCHGEDVLGTTMAPHLIVSVKPNGPINSKELFVKTVCEGRPEKGMPAWCPLGLDNAKIEAIHDYVKGRSEGKIHPGRPALKPAG
jgi:mono/diheme cytochrome c family protein